MVISLNLQYIILELKRKFNKCKIIKKKGRFYLMKVKGLILSTISIIMLIVSIFMTKMPAYKPMSLYVIIGAMVIGVIGVVMAMNSDIAKGTKGNKK